MRACEGAGLDFPSLEPTRRHITVSGAPRAAEQLDEPHSIRLEPLCPRRSVRFHPDRDPEGARAKAKNCSTVEPSALADQARDKASPQSLTQK